MTPICTHDASPEVFPRGKYPRPTGGLGTFTGLAICPSPPPPPSRRKQPGPTDPWKDVVARTRLRQLGFFLAGATSTFLTFCPSDIVVNKRYVGLVVDGLTHEFCRWRKVRTGSGFTYPEDHETKEMSLSWRSGYGSCKFINGVIWADKNESGAQDIKASLTGRLYITHVDKDHGFKGRFFDQEWDKI